MEPCFVGLNVHKKTIQIFIIDADGNELANKKIQNNPGEIKDNLGYLHPDSKLVIESSSVWKAAFFQIRDELHLDVILSNPRMNRLIAESKRKTDKVDTQILADLLRGDYVAACHVPDEDTVNKQQLVRYRHKMVQESTRFKNIIHGILLQEGIDIPGTPFCAPYTKRLIQLNNWRIDQASKESSLCYRQYHVCQPANQTKSKGG